MEHNDKIFLEKHRLFRECLESLGATMLSIQDTIQLLRTFKQCFPIAQWGKIDWDKVDHKIEIGYDPQEILPALEKLLGRKADTSVYILWSSATFPIIKTDLHAITAHFDDVTCVSHEKFIFNLDGYVLEILFGGSMTIGVVPKCSELTI